jgi:2-keto-3-deoxy-L-rhamnonate aldolase RhmA
MAVISETSAPRMRSLRDRVRAGKPVVGTFVKTTSPQTVEILGHSGMDFAVLDAEHAPFGIDGLDSAIGAACGVDFPAIVRVPDHGKAFINSCLDMGAAGILVPHTLSGADADGVADAVKYGRGKRGFSPSGRAGRYGQIDFEAYRTSTDATSNIWCQIEDRSAMDHLDEIAANDVVDCLFIGPADLGLSLACDGPKDPRLAEAIRAIADAGRRHGRAVGLYVPNTDSIADMLAIGISLFICGSDQGLMLGRAKQVAADVTALDRA